jgi:protein ImuB
MGKADGHWAGMGVSTACVLVPALPLQMLGKTHPEFRAEPLVVVEDDRPLARIRYVNQAALRYRVRPGMRFREAQVLSACLRGLVVSDREVNETQDILLQRLISFSPFVELGKDRPGLFWMDPRGMLSLYPDHQTWGQAIVHALEALGYVGTVAVGFVRLFLLAVAHTSKGVTVFSDPKAERKAASRVHLDRMGVSARLVADLALLGVSQLGAFLRLPKAELHQRFGEEAFRLFAMSQEFGRPIQPDIPCAPFAFEMHFEPPDDDLYRILFGMKCELQNIAPKILEKGEGIRMIKAEFRFQRHAPWFESIETARPTLDCVTLIDLLRLRLSTKKFPSAVVTVAVVLDTIRTVGMQVGLFPSASRRDEEAGLRALKRLQAAFGPEAVVKAVLQPGHLPEAQFRWEVCSDFPQTANGDGDDVPLAWVRRLYQHAEPLPPYPNHQAENWLEPHGAVVDMHGPYRVSGGWWHRRVVRDYFYVETQLQKILWVYYDRPRQSWFLQGSVE